MTRFKLCLHPGDYVVAAFPFRDFVVIVTRIGYVYHATYTDDGAPLFTLQQQ